MHIYQWWLAVLEWSSLLERKVTIGVTVRLFRQESGTNHLLLFLDNNQSITGKFQKRLWEPSGIIAIWKCRLAGNKASNPLTDWLTGAARVVRQSFHDRSCLFCQKGKKRKNGRSQYHSCWSAKPVWAAHWWLKKALLAQPLSCFCGGVITSRYHVIARILRNVDASMACSVCQSGCRVEPFTATLSLRTAANVDITHTRSDVKVKL